MVNFGFSGQFESKSQRYSDSRRIGANAACGLFVNFWSFDVTLSLSKGLSQAALGGTVNSHTASVVGMTKCHPEPVEGSRQCNKAEMLRQAQHDRFYRSGGFAVLHMTIFSNGFKMKEEAQPSGRPSS